MVIVEPGDKRKIDVVISGLIIHSMARSGEQSIDIAKLAFPTASDASSFD